MRDVAADKMTVAKVLANFASPTLPLNSVYYAALMILPHVLTLNKVGLPALLSIPLTATCILRVYMEDAGNRISAELPEMTAKAQSVFGASVCIALAFEGNLKLGLLAIVFVAGTVPLTLEQYTAINTDSKVKVK